MTIRSIVGQTEGFGESNYSLIGANPSVIDGNFESISTVTVASLGSNFLDINSIPQTYKHLQLRIFIRLLIGSNPADFEMKFNTNSSNTYNRYFLAGNGSSAFQNSSTTQTKITLPGVGTQTASTYAFHIIDIPEYTNTSKFKTITSFYGREINSSTDSQVGIFTGAWRNTAAINSINFYSTGEFVPGTTLSLYGVKA